MQRQPISHYCLQFRKLLEDAAWLTVAGVLLVTGCSPAAKAPVKESKLQSAQVLVTSSLMGLSVAAVSQIGKATIGWIWGRELDRFVSPTPVGDQAMEESLKAASALRAELQFEKSLMVQSKLNSLQRSLRNDYIFGLPESGTQLVLLADKSNDLMAQLEQFGDDSAGIPSWATALGNISSYATVTTLKLMIQTQRLQEAKARPATSETLKAISKAIGVTAQESANYLRKLSGATAEKYIKKQLLIYKDEVIYGREEFGTQFGVSYRSCALIKETSEKVCAEPSSKICANDFDLGCLSIALEQAKAGMTKDRPDRTLIDKIRNQWQPAQLLDFLVQLEKIAKNPPQ
jgi:hypothetical protein